MENLIELLKKIITNVLTALYQPFWFAVILTVFLLFFYLYTYKPIDTGKGIRAAFRAWWQEFRTSLFFRKLFLLTFFTVMILFQTLINRNMWINPLSDIMGGWWIWHTAADGTVTLTTECFENIALMLPFTALLLWTVAEKIFCGRKITFERCVWISTKTAFLFSLAIEFLQLFLRLGTFQLSDYVAPGVANRKARQQILIVDDSEMNRAILSEMLKKDFDILEAENGKECLDILQQYGMGISLVLLDIVMPVVDGFEVLDMMVHNRWIEDIPVIMISSEDSEPYIRRAYELGVSDYINRPFDAKVVYQRVYNTIKLYAKQRKLVTLVTDQIYEKEKNNQMMISILSQIVEFRNGESGLHVLHINILSELLLERLVQKTDKYQISAQRRSLITTASALHDIGKIGIDDKILNKPGRLTPEEFDEMKKHTIIGESILKNVGIYQNEELVQLAMQICRWHHERYDGRGYPDGLKGEEIPIEVQVVSIADVYDALVSERVYKKAYSHKKAVEMILNGECGQFNPLLLECLQDIQDRIDEEFQNVENQSEEENQERKVHDQIMETTVLG